MEIPDDVLIRDIKTLFDIKPLHDAFCGKLFETRELFRDMIADHFEKKINVIPFPGKKTVNYYFRLFSFLGAEETRWLPTLKDKDVHVPWDSILPYDLIETIIGYPVDGDQVVQLNDIQYMGDVFHIYFIKYLDNAVVGIVQKMVQNGEKMNGRDTSYDASQFMNLPEEEQVQIFLRYFNAKPGIRRKILFDFFTTVMPSPSLLKDVT